MYMGRVRWEEGERWEEGLGGRGGGVGSGEMGGSTLTKYPLKA